MKELKSLPMAITGISCSNCAYKIEMAVSKLEGIDHVSVDVVGERMTVSYDASLVKEKNIVEAVVQSGYEVAIGTLKWKVVGLRNQMDASVLKRKLKELSGLLEVEIEESLQFLEIRYLVGAIYVADIVSVMRSLQVYLFEAEGPKEDSRDHEDLIRLQEYKKQLYMVLMGVVVTIPLVIYSMLNDFFPFRLPYDLLIMAFMATVVQFGIGGGFYKGAYQSLRLKTTNMDVLIVLGSTMAYLISLLATFHFISLKDVYFETSAAIITLVRLGKFLEFRAKGKTQESLRSLMALKVKMATRINKRGESSVLVDHLGVGDLILVRPGEMIALDGVVCEGSSSVDESLLTGESLPVSKVVGQKVFGSSLNKEGMLKIEVTQVGGETFLSQLINLVQDAQKTKAPIEKITDTIGRYFVPIIIVISFFTFILWFFFAGGSLEFSLMNAIAVLVIACPCAIGLATPTAMTVAFSRAARMGFLVKNGEVLEKLGQIQLVAFDKTGTLTEGVLEVNETLTFSNTTPQEVLFFAASAEKGSLHPLARAIADEALRLDVALQPPEQFASYGGLGVRAKVASKTVWVGNLRFLKQEGVYVDEEALFLKLEQEHLLDSVMVMVGLEREEGSAPTLIGVMTFSDRPREGAAFVVQSLKNMGIQVAMVTGDHKAQAQSMGKLLGIDLIFHDALPEDKVSIINKLKNSHLSTEERLSVLMVGDGINDALALSSADVGVAMGIGSDVAKATAGVTLMTENLTFLLEAISLSKATSKTILQNLVWAFFYNVCLIPIALYGLLVPMFAAGAMTFSSLFVVMNSLKLKTLTLDKLGNKKTFFQEIIGLTPQLLWPFLGLAFLVIFPMWFMPSSMDIQGVRNSEQMTPFLMMVMAIANGLIAISYGSIPVFLLIFVLKRKDLPFSWILFLFGMFILSCGVTHIVHIMALWVNVNILQALADSLCALISLMTALLLWPMLPKMLALPSPSQLQEVNRSLAQERLKLLRAQEDLERSYKRATQNVVVRTKELLEANEKLIVEKEERKTVEEDKSKLQTQLAQSQKMESVGRLAGGVAHDFNNMLGVILGHAELLQREISSESSAYSHLVEINKAAERSANLTRQLLAFARKQTVAPRLINLNEIIEGMLKMLKRLIGENIELIWRPSHDLWTIRIDPSQIDQILANLVVNARDAISNVGKIVIETENHYFDSDYCSRHSEFMEGEYVQLRVSDTGKGIKQRDLEHIFEPFYTTKAVGEGTGLGLATVYGIVKQNNGFINVYSEEGFGTAFRVYFRRDISEAEKGESLRYVPTVLEPKTILLVEDELSNLQLFSVLLEGAGHRVIKALHPLDAIALAQKSPEKIDLLLTDVIMPEMNGNDLSHKLKELYPDLLCLFMSGYTADIIAHHGVLDSNIQFIQKPFSSKELFDKMAELFDPLKNKKR